MTEPAAGIPAGWTFVSVTPSGSVAVAENQTITFTVVNERELGSVKIVKDIAGEPVAGARTEFTVNLDCSPGTAYDQTGVKLNEGNSWTPVQQHPVRGDLPGDRAGGRYPGRLGLRLGHPVGQRGCRGGRDHHLHGGQRA